MVKKLNVELPEDIYAAMLVLSKVTRQSPEEMAAEWVTMAVMAVTAITGKPLQVAKSMSMGTSPGMPTDVPAGVPTSMSIGISPYDTTGTRSGKMSQTKGAANNPNKEAAKAIYQLKVTLRDSKPPIQDPGAGQHNPREAAQSAASGDGLGGLPPAPVHRGRCLLRHKGP